MNAKPLPLLALVSIVEDYLDKMRVRDVTELLRREFGSYLEMYLNGTWQGVCADPHVVKSVNAGNSKGAYALKACEAAGFGVGVKHKAGKLWKDAYGGAFYTGHDRVMLHANCNGTEDDIYSCDGFSVEKVPDDSCDVAYLRCYDTYFDDIRPLVGPFCGAPNPSFGDLLFSPSEDGAEHHICYNAITGAVISHGSKSLNGIRTGVITSPNWPGESPSFIDCRWFLEFAMLSGKAFRTLELDTYFPSPPSSDLLEFRSADAWWGGYQFNDSMFEDDLYGFLQTEGECLHSKDICLEGFTLQNYNSSVSIKKEVIGATEELAIRYLSLSHTPANTDSGRKHAFRYKWRYFLYGETSGIYPLRSAGLYLLLAFALVVQV
ncbi:PREDICTED: uncharacterized protein LOC106807086 isoform X3 [Priapulus caudatus]|uniref:Uncharacterized protein LOC106807086 isoform X3 n=1 Tax=Priapulus caudatus TaxID=37621 RepID=A0ABM1DXZ9_PRICU|nr:PREDICTED: uncharacterized protein LOC106807086 isoform X3 [Priapulus caudatus]